MKNKMGRPTKLKKNILSERIQFAITKKEKSLIVEITEDLDITISSWLRNIVLNHLKEEEKRYKCKTS